MMQIDSIADAIADADTIEDVDTISDIDTMADGIADSNTIAKTIA